MFEFSSFSNRKEGLKFFLIGGLSMCLSSLLQAADWREIKVFLDRGISRREKYFAKNIGSQGKD